MYPGNNETLVPPPHTYCRTDKTKKEKEIEASLIIVTENLHSSNLAVVVVGFLTFSSPHF